MCETIEKAVTTIPNRNDLTEERLGMKILKQLRSPDSAQMEKIKKDAVFMQARFPQIDFTSNLAHRKHAFSLTHPHPLEKSSWLHPKPLPLAPCRTPNYLLSDKKGLITSPRFSSGLRSKLMRATAATASLKA